MSLALELTEIAGYIEAIVRTTPFRRVKTLKLEAEPFQATETERHFEEHDEGLEKVIVDGVATQPRIELRKISLRIKYVYEGDYADLEGEMSTDRESITDVLTNPATYAASYSIQAILMDIVSSIDRDKDNGFCIMTLTPRVHVAIY
jgi:hypothetical protein